MSFIKIDGGLTGNINLEKLFEQLPIKVQRNACRRAATKANKQFRDQAKANVPVMSGRLRKNIKSKVSLKRDMVIGRTGVQSKKKQGFYANYIEYGTVTRYHKKPTAISTMRMQSGDTAWWRKIKSRPGGKIALGRFPATRFMKRAFLSKKGYALAAFRKEIWKTIVTEGRKQWMHDPKGFLG